MKNWSVDNYSEMNILKVILLIIVALLVTAVGYKILYIKNTEYTSLWIMLPLVPALLVTLINRPKYIQIGIRDSFLFLNKKDVFQSRNSNRLVIPSNKLISCELEQPKSLFKGKLIITFQSEDNEKSTEHVSLNKFTFNKREEIIKNIQAL